MDRKLEAINNVVCGYIGDIYSVGSCQEDEKALRMLNLTMNLIECQMNGIIDEYRQTKDRYEGSRQKSHKLCETYLLSLQETVKRVLEDE